MTRNDSAEVVQAVDVLASEASRLAEWAVEQKPPYEVYMVALTVIDVIERMPDWRRALARLAGDLDVAWVPSPDIQEADR